MRLYLVLAVVILAGLNAGDARAQTGSYEQGIADWRTLQAWVQTQAGDSRAGADYWSGNRSRAGHQSCAEAADTFSGDRSSFVAGCEEAKRRLGPIDAKRLSDSMYRAGFNYAAEELPISPPSGPRAGDVVPAPPPSPASAAADGSSDASFKCRDPKTDFEYSRSLPCADGDVVLASPQGYPKSGCGSYAYWGAPGAGCVPNGLAAPRGASAPPHVAAARADPLLAAVHERLVKRAENVCAEANSTYSREACSDAFRSTEESQEEATDKCSQSLLSTNRKLCPDGPEKLAETMEAAQLSSTINFRDFVLDKEEMADVGKLIIIRGVYIRAADSMDYLLAPGQINPMAYGRSLNSDVAIPLLLDDAKFGGTSRETRAALLTCRERYPPETFTGCAVELDGFVQKCSITMQLTNASHEAVCIKVSDVTVDPRS